MPQLFSPHADRIVRLSLALAGAGAVGLAVLGHLLVRTDRARDIGVPAPQPIPFSHAVHSGRLGLDCRYCHARVERAAEAGMPSAELCLGCHARIWTAAAPLAPLRDSLEMDAPIRWGSVHRLPDHVRFNHAAHVAKGVACETCHGPVRTMPRTVKVQPLSMGWCLDCHRDPAPALRPSDAPMDRAWTGTAGGGALAAHDGIRPDRLTDCTICHR